MRHVIPIFLNAFIMLSLFACNTGGRGIFTQKTAREKYEDRIEKIETPEVMAWKKQGDKVLQSPLMVPAPYAETGIFNGDSTDANAFFITAAPGQKLNISISPVSGSTFTAFLELWNASEAGKPKLIKAADTLLNAIEYSAANGGNFIVRIQPKLSSRGTYHLKINLHPLLDFPVSSTVKSNIGSLWGDPRDGGVRKHEGIDIFAKKGSPVVAVSDGIVSRVANGGIGGKTIWFNPADADFSVYYAHLDTQYVSSGQRVVSGQVLGTVGNTGNAKNTAAHLHFGIYASGGAVNPLAFVQPVKEPVMVAANKLNETYRTDAKTKVYPSPDKKNAIMLNQSPGYLQTRSVINGFYRVVLNDGRSGFVASNELSSKMKM